MEIKNLPIYCVFEYALNNKRHSQEQIDRIANSISEFGFNQPLVVDESGVILVGHGRLAAAKKLKLESIPVLQINNLSDTQKRAYRILDNKLSDDAEWDFENLRMEIERLQEENYPTEAWGLDALISAYADGVIS